MKMGLSPKCSEENSAVKGQVSGVRGKNRGQISIFVFFLFFSRFDQLVTPVLTPDPWPPTPDPWPLTVECSSEHFGTNPIFIAQKLTSWEHYLWNSRNADFTSGNRVKTWGGRELLSRGQFSSYEDEVGTKMLRRPLPNQGSEVRGQGSGVRGQKRGQISRFGYFFSFFLGLINLWPLFWPLTPDPRPLTSDSWLWNALLSIWVPIPSW